MTTKLKKRTWHYIQNPKEYEIHCDKCDGINIEWSEYKSKIWCYDCKIDTDGTGGVFSGPIPINLAGVLGMHFHIWDMKKKRIRYFDPKTGLHRARTTLSEEEVNYEVNHQITSKHPEVKNEEETKT